MRAVVPPLRLTDTHRRVYQLVRTRGPLSRADVVRVTGFTFPTISRIIAEFVAAGLLEETQVRRGGMGKPPIDLALRPQHANSLGLSYSGDLLQGVVADAAGAVVQRAEISAGDKSLADAVKELVGQLETPNQPIGLGLVCEGELPTGAELEVLGKALGFPVYAVSRAGAGALLERYFGAAQSLDSFVYLEVADSVSSAVMLGGRLLAPAEQLSGLLALLGAEPTPGRAWQEQLPGITKALLVAAQLLAPEALIVGGNVTDAELDVLARSLEANQLTQGTPNQLLKGLENPDRLTLAAATLPLYVRFATATAN